LTPPTILLSFWQKYVGSFFDIFSFLGLEYQKLATKIWD